MKNFIKISLMAAISFMAVSAHATDDDLSLNVKSERDKSIRFSINEAKDINLSLYEENNELLFKQDIHALAASVKTYDLSALPDGNYVLKLQSDSRLTAYQIEIRNDKVLVSEPAVTEMMKPVLAMESGIISLNLNNVQESPVEIQILNENNEKLYSQVFKNAKLFKKFDVNQTDAKELTFVIKSDNQEFIKTIEVQ